MNHELIPQQNEFEEESYFNKPEELLPLHIREIESRRAWGDPNRPKPKFESRLDWQINGIKKPIECAGNGDLVLVKGKQKSRKSTVVKAILSGAFLKTQKYTLGFNLKLDDDECILHFDTEMNFKRETEKHKEKFDKLCMRNFQDEQYKVYNIKPYNYKQRIEIISYKIEELLNQKVKIGALVIDQIADLVMGYDVNEAKSANYARELLEHWTNITDSIMFMVMHTNRGGLDANGRFGKWIEDKIYCSFRCTYDLQNHVSLLVNDLSREIRIPDIMFDHDPEGNPRFLEKNEIF